MDRGVGDRTMKEGVCVLELMEYGGAYNTYPIDPKIANKEALWEFIHRLKERGFVERHGDYLRWYSPQAIQSVTWKIRGEGLTRDPEGAIAIQEG